MLARRLNLSVCPRGVSPVPAMAVIAALVASLVYWPGTTFGLVVKGPVSHDRPAMASEPWLDAEDDARPDDDHVKRGIADAAYQHATDLSCLPWAHAPQPPQERGALANRFQLEIVQRI
jgi:hypothetical protein